MLYSLAEWRRKTLSFVDMTLHKFLWIRLGKAQARTRGKGKGKGKGKAVKDRGNKGACPGVVSESAGVASGKRLKRCETGVDRCRKIGAEQADRLQ